MDPIQYIEAEMAHRGLKRSDIECAFGTRARTAEVLNRRRWLSLAMIRRLHDQFGFSAEKLIQKYELSR